MKTFKTFTFGLFILSLHQASYGITERDVRSFGENDEFINFLDNNSERGRLLVAHAHQNIARNAQAPSKPIAIPTQTQTFKPSVVEKAIITHTGNTTTTTQEQAKKPKDTLACSPNSVWEWVVYSWTGSNK